MNGINLIDLKKDSLPNLSIHSLLKSHAERIPDAVAIAAPERQTLKYKVLYDHVINMAETLKQMGIGRNDRVAIVLPNGPEMVTAFLTIAMGATSAPLNHIQWREDQQKPGMWL